MSYSKISLTAIVQRPCYPPGQLIQHHVQWCLNQIHRILRGGITKQSQSSDISSMLLQLKFQSLRTQSFLKNACVTMHYKKYILLPLKFVTTLSLVSLNKSLDSRCGSPLFKLFITKVALNVFPHVFVSWLLNENFQDSLEQINERFVLYIYFFVWSCMYTFSDCVSNTNS